MFQCNGSDEETKTISAREMLGYCEEEMQSHSYFGIQKMGQTHSCYQSQEKMSPESSKVNKKENTNVKLLSGFYHLVCSLS